MISINQAVYIVYIYIYKNGTTEGFGVSTFCSLPINFERKMVKKVGDGQKVPMASHHGRGLISRENGRQAGFGGRRGSSHLQCLERRKLLETTRSTLQNPLLFHYIYTIYTASEVSPPFDHQPTSKDQHNAGKWPSHIRVRSLPKGCPDARTMPSIE